MTHSQLRYRSIVPLFAAFFVACGGAAPAPPPSAAPAAVSSNAAAAAGEIFLTRCSVCHGAEGRADGPGAKILTPPPRDLTSTAWQASVTDTYIERIIVEGGAAVGRSAAMPPNPDLRLQPDVVAALRLHVRSLAAR